MKKYFIRFIGGLSLGFILLAFNGKAQVPQETGNFKKTDLVELKKIVPNVKLDIRYATTNNFTHHAVYTQARAFIQRPAAGALVKVALALKPLGYGLLVFDGYRPWSVTKIFWDVTSADQKNFVANPKKGSRHNRGCAVDLSLYDLKTGKEIEMTGAYDEMTGRSYPSYSGGTDKQRKARDLLRSTMEAQGFKVNPFEWWHYDYKDWPLYAITNVPFSEIK